MEGSKIILFVLQPPLFQSHTDEYNFAGFSRFSRFEVSL